MRAMAPIVLAACLVLAAAAQATTPSGLDFELEPIELAPVASISVGRTLLEAASSGGYGGGYGGYGGYGYGAAGVHRRLMAGAYGGGGYGGYGGYGYGAEAGAGASGPRSLLEQPGGQAAMEPFGAALLAAQQLQQAQEQERLASASAAAERRAEQQRQAAAGAGGSDAGVTAAHAAALRGARAAAASSLLSAPAGQCYCRYDADYNTWALGEVACKDALAAKCKAGQLPCSWLDAYYGHAAAGAAHTLPHEQDILGFVFDDCQPHPPCACAGVKFDGSDAVTSSYACCRDLRAACRTPFNGLSCGDVEAFCRDDAPSSKLLHWAQHKLHRGAECSGYAGLPYEFVSLDDIMAANNADAAAAGGDADGALLVSDALAGSEARAEGAVSEVAAAAAPAAGAPGSSRVAVAALGLGCMLVGAAVVGMALTLRAGGDDGGEALGPLLHPVPEVPGGGSRRGGASVRHVISSNYILSSGPPSRASGPPSRTSSGAAPEAGPSRQQQ